RLVEARAERASGLEDEDLLVGPDVLRLFPRRPDHDARADAERMKILFVLVAPRVADEPLDARLKSRIDGRERRFGVLARLEAHDERDGARRSGDERPLIALLHAGGAELEHLTAAVFGFLFGNVEGDEP